MSFKQPKWGMKLSHLVGRTREESALLELDEMERELRRLQMACQRLRAFVKSNGATPVGRVPELHQHFLALDGWCVSVVESYFSLLGLLLNRNDQHQTMIRWSRDIHTHDVPHRSCDDPNRGVPIRID